jgi:hypothetical protein
MDLRLLLLLIYDSTLFFELFPLLLKLLIEMLP